MHTLVKHLTKIICNTLFLTFLLISAFSSISFAEQSVEEIIKTRQSIFSNKTALLFKVFISKVSWFTFIAACYFGYKNFSFKATLIGIAAAVVMVHLGFFFLSNYLSKKIGQENLIKIKTVFEYALIVLIVYFVFF